MIDVDVHIRLRILAPFARDGPDSAALIWVSEGSGIVYLA